MTRLSLSVFFPLCYLVFLPFTKLIYHPATGYSVQLPELFFLIWVGCVVCYRPWRERLLSRRFDLLDRAVVVLLISQWLSAAVQGQWMGNMAVFGLLYLSLVYHVIRSQMPVIVWQNLRQLRSGIRWFGILLLLTIVGSWAYVYLFPHGELELIEAKYLPGIGTVYRVEAFTMSPNMLMNMILLPLLVSVADWRTDKSLGGILWIALFGLFALMTFSKSLMLAVVGLVILLFWHPTNLWRWLTVGIVGLAIISFWVSSKFIRISHDQFDKEIILSADYMEGDVVWSNQHSAWYSTMYHRLNQDAVEAFQQSPWLGVGPGQFIEYIDAQKAAGRYPADKLSYQPHDLYLGMLAQGGILGMAGLIFFLYTIGHTWQSIWRVASTENGKWLVLALGLYLLIWAVDGLAMDTLHFRQFWWVLGVLASSKQHDWAG